MSHPHIKRPVTDDGMVGFDECGNFMASWIDRIGYTVSTPVCDVREMTCIICNRGWEPNADSMLDQQHWDLLDVSTMGRSEERGVLERKVRQAGMVHATCLSRHFGLVERERFYWALVDARVRFCGLKPIANGYWSTPEPRRGDAQGLKPWYQAELLDHPAMFVLGRRKRVDHIEVVPQGGTKLAWHAEAERAFAAEDVTKHFGESSVLIHAHTREASLSYVKRLVELGGYQIVRVP